MQTRAIETSNLNTHTPEKRYHDQVGADYTGVESSSEGFKYMCKRVVCVSVWVCTLRVVDDDDDALLILCLVCAVYFFCSSVGKLLYDDWDVHMCEIWV